MNAVLVNLQARFGKVLAARIYACALIQLDKMSDKALEGTVLDLLDSVRYTLGMLKRMRNQSIESGKVTTWESAIDRLENEQVEGRHYRFRSASARSVGQIEAVNKATYKVDKWSAMIEAHAIEHEATVTAKATDAVEAKLVLESFLTSLTHKRLVWFMGVVAGLRRGQELTRRQSQAISNRYTPEGVKTSDFVELAVRYA